MVRKVFIEGLDQALIDMFLEEGWEIAGRVEIADMLCLEGGVDVNPLLYGKSCHPRTHYSTAKDVETIDLIEEARLKGVPIVGICRGGQMLCAVYTEGGSLYQHITGHNMVNEVLRYGGKDYSVTSDHHQAFKLGTDAAPLIHCEEDRGGYCKAFYVHNEVNMLGYQPHPEWDAKGSKGRELFFTLVEEYLF